MKITLIAAVGRNGVIGTDGDLPWNLPKDMKFFATKTRGHHVLMGRKNFESIPEKYRPLPGRPNLVVTRQIDFYPFGVEVFSSIEAAIEFARSQMEEELFIIGGGEIYKQTIDFADKLYITHVDAEPRGDAYFPEIDDQLYEKTLISEVQMDDTHDHNFKIYQYVKKV